MGRFGQTIDGTRQITAFHIDGDMPDLSSVPLSEAPAALQALTATTVMRIPHHSLRALAARFPAVAEAFWRDCVVDMGITVQWMTNVGRRNAQVRLGHLLCEMAVRYQRIGIGERSRFLFGGTQEHLADATGLTNVHVSRSLQAMRRAGLVDYKSGEISILDWDGLKALGQFDPAYLMLDVKSARYCG
jgi:CRP-like cAMP-binding protein